MSTKQRIIHGIGANGFGQFITILIQIASVPILISAWGIELYGEWIALSAIPAYLALSDIGLTTIAGNTLALNAAESGNEKKMQSVFQSAWAMVSLFSMSLLMLILLVIWLTDLSELIGLTYIKGAELNLTLLLLFLHVAMCLQTGLIQIPFRVIKRNPFAVTALNVIRLLEWTVATIAVLSGYTVVAVALSFFVVRLTGNIILYIVMSRLECSLSFGFKFANMQTIRTLLRPSLASMCFPLGLSLTMQGFIIMISVTIGSTGVALFSIYRTFTRLPIQIATSINQSVWPELSYAFGENDISKAKVLVLKMLQFGFLLCVLSGFAIYFMGEYIIDLWIPHPLEHNPYLLIALTLTSLAHILWQPFWVAQIAINKHVRFAISFLSISALSLILGWIFLRRFDLEGAGYAIVFSEFLMALAAYVTFRLNFRAISNE